MTSNEHIADPYKQNICVRSQVPLQAYLRPAEWALGIRSGRRAARMLKVNGRAEEIIDAFRGICQNLTQLELEKLRSPSCVIPDSFTGQNSLTIYMITNAGWLDIMDVHCTSTPTSQNRDACTVRLTLASTGFIPLKVAIVAHLYILSYI